MDYKHKVKFYKLVVPVFPLSFDDCLNVCDSIHGIWHLTSESILVILLISKDERVQGDMLYVWRE